MPNLKLFQLTSYQDVLIIKSDLHYLTTQLKFYRTSSIIEEQPKNTQYNGKIKAEKRFSYVLGIFKTFNKPFIVLVEECTRVAKIHDQEIYHIDQVSFVCIEENNVNQNKDILETLQNIKKLLQNGFYFSLNGDITLARHFQKYENSFVWNQKLMSPLRENKISLSWQLPIIQGYVEQIESLVENKTVSIVLISRRSRFMGGTRYYSRGVNDEGHVANFIETEQILIQGDILISFVTIRGSVPLFWTQDGISSIKLTRSKDLTQPAFIKHFNLLRRYGKVFCVNLLSNGRQVEQMLSDNFHYQYQTAQLDHVTYQFLDFNALVKNGKSTGVNSYIKQYDQVLDKFQCYVEKEKQTLTKQAGVFRINCLDCLDRTNLFQSKLSLYSLDRSLKILELKLSSNPDILDQFDESNKKLLHDLIIKFKNMWANNGDMLSFLYSGSGSPISEMAREGKKGFMGMIKEQFNNLDRIYQRKFEDDVKQQSINQLIHGHQSHTHFDQWIAQQEKNYCNSNQVSVLLTTWNVGGNTPTTTDFSSNILNFAEYQQPNPDVVVFGLQEIVDLNPQNIVIMSNEKTIQLWDQLIQQNLQKLEPYTKIGEADLVGLYITIWVKTTNVSRIAEIDVDSIKTGLGGTLGNKGGVAVKFRFDDSNLGFICCHLSSGNKQLQQRFSDADEIHQKAFLNSKYRISLSCIDYTFFFGDMNFRLDLQYQEVVEKIRSYQAYLAQDPDSHQANAILAYLLSSDQLIKFKNQNQFLQNYSEGTINFLPTYKYDKNCQIYDTSKKLRTPSWCDRILVSCKEELICQQVFYKRSECLDSDHRPVSSYYIIEARKIDKDKLNDIRATYCLSKMQKDTHQKLQQPHQYQQTQQQSQSFQQPTKQQSQPQQQQQQTQMTQFYQQQQQNQQVYQQQPVPQFYQNQQTHQQNIQFQKQQQPSTPFDDYQEYFEDNQNQQQFNMQKDVKQQQQFQNQPQQVIKNNNNVQFDLINMDYQPQKQNPPIQQQNNQQVRHYPNQQPDLL